MTFEPEPKWEIRHDRFILDNEVLYRSALGDFRIPAGQTTDFASLPWWSGFVFPKISEPRAKGALIHDQLYQKAPTVVYKDGRELQVTRKHADHVFHRVMHEEGHPSPIRTFLMWTALRWFGWIAWNKHRKTTPAGSVRFEAEGAKAEALAGIEVALAKQAARDDATAAEAAGPTHPPV